MPRRTLVPALLAALLAAGPALAAPALDGASIRVRVADLDLQSAPGARTALQRIRRAADTVCGGEPDARDLIRQSQFQHCVRTAVDRTVAQSGSPALAALNGTPLAVRVLAAAD